mmetsp:Transcript_130460/g.377392  ORF Transcript_130460/g.377392 Transcript_130460/m.377392 type:complete len:280 (-) Transcript_130460:472-1311(-)
MRTDSEPLRKGVDAVLAQGHDLLAHDGIDRHTGLAIDVHATVRQQVLDGRRGPRPRGVVELRIAHLADDPVHRGNEFLDVELDEVEVCAVLEEELGDSGGGRPVAQVHVPVLDIERRLDAAALPEGAGLLAGRELEDATWHVGEARDGHILRPVPQHWDLLVDDLWRQTAIHMWAHPLRPLLARRLLPDGHGLLVPRHNAQALEGRAPEAQADPIASDVLVEVVRRVDQARGHGSGVREAILLEGRRKVGLPCLLRGLPERFLAHVVQNLGRLFLGRGL